MLILMSTSASLCLKQNLRSSHLQSLQPADRGSGKTEPAVTEAVGDHGELISFISLVEAPVSPISPLYIKNPPKGNRHGGSHVKKEKRKKRKEKKLYCFPIVWSYDEMWHLLLPRVTLRPFPDSQWRCVCANMRVEGRDPRETHLTKANRDAIEETRDGRTGKTRAHFHWSAAILKHSLHIPARTEIYGPGCYRRTSPWHGDAHMKSPFLTCQCCAMKSTPIQKTSCITHPKNKCNQVRGKRQVLHSVKKRF